jgi:hypothetical protein
VLNDHWLGDYRTTPSREADQLLPEEGRFLGAQDGPRMIGIYAPRQLGAWARHHSAKAMLLWLDRRFIDELWVGETRVSSLPAHVPPGETVVVASGEVYFAVQPLSCTDLGRDAPVRLVDIDGHLALEIYNYLGPAKTFWELANPGSFYKRQPQCGFYLEIANKADHDHALAFGRSVSASMILDELRPLAEWDRGPNGLWHVEVGRGPHRLGLEVDLVHWRLMRRWNEGGDLAFPMLESPVARETRTGHVSVGGATLTCGKGAAWLVALPEQKLYVAAIHGEHAAPVELVIPDGRVTIERMHAGLITWQDGRVFIEPPGAGQGVGVEGGTLAHTIPSA